MPDNADALRAALKILLWRCVTAEDSCACEPESQTDACLAVRAIGWAQHFDLEVTEARLEIESDAARELLAGLASNAHPTVAQIAQNYCVTHGIKPESLRQKTPGRSSALSKHRKIVWKLCREAGYSYPQIAKHFGFDHTTVMHSVRDKKRSRARAKPKLEP